MNLTGCEVCKKKASNELHAYILPPPEWITTMQWDRYGNEEQKYFCSKLCLVQWAGKSTSNYYKIIDGLYHLSSKSDQLQDLKDFMHRLTRSGMASADVAREVYNYAVAMMPPELSAREGLDFASRLMEQVTKVEQNQDGSITITGIQLRHNEDGLVVRVCRGGKWYIVISDKLQEDVHFRHTVDGKHLQEKVKEVE